MKVLLVLLVCLVCVSSIPLSHSVPNTDRYETMKIYHADNPKVCIMEPVDELKERFHSYMLKETFDAVMEWSSTMKRFSGGDWYMPIELHEYKDHFDKSVRDFTECNIFIEYEGVNDGSVVTSSALAYTSFDFSNSRQKYTYIKVYVQAEIISNKIILCVGCDSLPDLKSKKDMVYLLREDIRKIVLHEFGHALGLGHYIEDRDKTNNQNSIMLPQMTPFRTDNNEAGIYFIDKAVLVEIYSSDGFGGHNGITPKYFEIASILKDYVL